MTDYYQPEPPKSTSPLKVGLLVGLGCGIVIAVVLALVLGGALSLFGKFKEAAPFDEGLVLARSNPIIVERLGEPIQAGKRMSGNLNLSNDEGTADIYFPLIGPDGEATMHLVGTKEDGNWTFTTVEVQFEDSGEVLDLLGEEI